MVENEPAVAVLDTGSAISIINNQFVKKYNLSNVFEWDGPLVQVLSGQIVPLSKQCLVNIEILNHTISISCGVIPQFPHDILLGMDYLSSTPFTLHFNPLLLLRPTQDARTFHFIRLSAAGPTSTLTSVSKQRIEQGPFDFRAKNFHLEITSPATHHRSLKRLITASSYSSTLNHDSRVNVPKTSYDLRVDVPQTSSDLRVNVRKTMAVPATVFVALPIQSAIHNQTTNIQPIPNNQLSPTSIPDPSLTFRNGIAVHVPVLTASKEEIISDDADSFWIPLKDQEGHLDWTEVSQKDLPFDIEPSLSTSQATQLKNLLESFEHIFSSKSRPLARTHVMEHHIDTQQAKPVHDHLRRFSDLQKKEIDSQINEMLAAGIISPCQSEWSSNIVLVIKKDGTMRLCIDYRKLNSVTKRDLYPIVRIDECLDALRGSHFFTGLDLASGYWQVPMAQDSKAKTAFITSNNQYQFEVMPFGLTNAPGTFSRMMDQVLGDLKFKHVIVYLDDVQVYSPTFDSHLVHLAEVFTRLEKAGLQLKPSKCSFAEKELEFLGHLISAEGIAPTNTRLKAISDFPKPTDLTTVKSFLGAARHYRRFVKDSSKIASSLHLLSHKNQPFTWREAQQAAFQQLKTALTTPPILTHYDPARDLILETDASMTGMGAVLTQVDPDGLKRVLAYACRSLSKAEKNYSTCEQELAAVVWAIHHFHAYLGGSKEFSVLTDHNALVGLLKTSNHTGRLARWKLALNPYHFNIQYRAGTLNNMADHLSRYPLDRGLAPVNHLLVVPLFHATTVDVAKLQREDPEVRKIIDILEGDKMVQQFKFKSNHYVIKGDILYRIVFRDSKPRFLLVVPAKLQKEILRNAHDNHGHMGIQSTYERIHEKYYWSDSLRQITQYVTSCLDCQMKKSPLQRPAGLLQPLRVNGPFHTVSMDYMGPFTTSKRRNQYIIVAIDSLTKWVEAKAVPAASAHHAAKFFVENVIMRHGAPTRLLTDRGTHFMSSFIEEIVKMLGVNHVTTTSYNPQCNGLVERMNKTIATSLSHYVASDHKDWDVYLPLVVFSINTAKQDTTQYSPFQLVYGRSPTLPIDVTLTFDGFTFTQNADDYAQLINTWLLSAREIANARVNAATEQRANNFNATHRHVEYLPGDQVLMWTPPKLKGGESKAIAGKLTTKLLHQWHGPYKVIEKLSDVNYRIQLIASPRRKNEIVHVRRLKPYHEAIEDRDFEDPPEALIPPQDLQDEDLSEVPQELLDSEAYSRPRRNLPKTKYSK